MLIFCCKYQNKMSNQLLTWRQLCKWWNQHHSWSLNTIEKNCCVRQLSSCLLGSIHLLQVCLYSLQLYILTPVDPFDYTWKYCLVRAGLCLYWRMLCWGKEPSGHYTLCFWTKSNWLTWPRLVWVPRPKQSKSSHCYTVWKREIPFLQCQQCHQDCPVVDF